MPRPSDVMLATIVNLQRFDSGEWSNVRYAKVLKEYVADPGFKDLDVNLEFQATNSVSTMFPSMERACAAIAHAALKQRQVLQESLQSLVQWSHDIQGDLSAEAMTAKVEELFCDDNAFSKHNDDILQIACGKRSEIIGFRRDKILGNCRNAYDRAALNKIPPSSTHLFGEDQLATQLQKLGGATKVLRQNRPFEQQPSQPAKPQAFAVTENKTKHASGGSRENKPFPFRFRRADPGSNASAGWPSTSSKRGSMRKSTRRGQTSHRRFL